MGNTRAMTLKDYIKTGATDIRKVASALGVSSHAVRKWVYGQRTPPLQTALAIVKLSKGKVDLHSLVKPEQVA
jgi:DNA-binding transcriptional regulator YdaS (Cro superfamily)